MQIKSYKIVNCCRNCMHSILDAEEDTRCIRIMDLPVVIDDAGWCKNYSKDMGK